MNNSSNREIEKRVRIPVGFFAFTYAQMRLKKAVNPYIPPSYGLNRKTSINKEVIVFIKLIHPIFSQKNYSHNPQYCSIFKNPQRVDKQ